MTEPTAAPLPEPLEATVELVTAIEALHTIASGFTLSKAYREAAATAVRVLQAVADDRDEWKRQHENLLDVRRRDLAALQSKLDEAAAALAQPAWRCYWCDAVFTDFGKADIHFGSAHSEQTAPECYRRIQRELAETKAALAQRDGIPRDPTVAMLEAAIRGEQDDVALQLRALAEKHWRRMYDAAPTGIPRDDARLRVMLACSYAGAALYHDDGELQDNREHPLIDFKRDSVDEIEEKMCQRAYRSLAALQEQTTTESNRGER